MDLDDVRAKLPWYVEDNATEWKFGWDGIGDEGTVALVAALRTNSTVQKVNLYCMARICGSCHTRWCIDNAMGPEGAKALAEALRTNATLREVYLGSNGIGDEGTVALAAALRTNPRCRRWTCTITRSAMTER
eukprot:EG_transcript_43758